MPIDQIPSQSSPFTYQAEDGVTRLEVEWYLFFYGLWTSVNPAGTSAGVVLTDSTNIPMSDIDGIIVPRPGGSLNSIQIQTPVGTFAGNSNFTYNPATNTLTLGPAAASSTIQAAAATVAGQAGGSIVLQPGNGQTTGAAGFVSVPLATTGSGTDGYFQVTGSSASLKVTNTTVSLTGLLGVYGATPVAQVTGFGAPTGAVLLTNFPGAAATLPQTSAMVAEILVVLQGLGLIGA